MKKKILFTFIIVLLVYTLTGCNGYEVRTDLIEPEYCPEINTGIKYEDKFLSITFYPIGNIRSVELELTNKTNKTMEIIWNEMVIVDSYNIARSIFHKEIKYIDKEKPIKNTILPPNSQKSTIIVPVDSIQWGKDGWEYTNLILESNDLSLETSKNFRIILPLLLNKERKEYNFKFKVYLVKREQK
jgi:hypothetical protein